MVHTVGASYYGQDRAVNQIPQIEKSMHGPSLYRRGDDDVSVALSALPCVPIMPVLSSHLLDFVRMQRLVGLDGTRDWLLERRMESLLP